MSKEQQLFLPVTSLVLIGFVTGTISDDWNIVIDVQAGAVIAAGLWYVLRLGRRR
jgi:hypothetical protein